tara:strand:- start:5036 stop:5965 length:930 start_codon:yes stop_codon:yes gene_type:complete
MNTKKLKIISFYKFIQISNPKKIKSSLDDFIKDKMFRGTIILANEGINASISGDGTDLKNLLGKIKILLKNKDFNIKKNFIEFLPFNKMKVKIKKEIVSLGKKEINVPEYTGKFISPENWNNLIKKKNVKLIDTRNEYEFNIGHFTNAINPKTKSFRDFPKKMGELGIKKNDEIVMYCTGGIRCEKISAFLQIEGYNNVSQLDGGILNFLENTKHTDNNNIWNGECFVFDNRVSVNKSLETGNYEQCHGCRHPITQIEKSLKSYKKGVSCKYCYNKRTLDQKKRSEMRQKQINKAEQKMVNHPFKRIQS